MTDNTIKTGVDDLIELLKHTDKINLTDAAQRLGIKQSLLQSWIDFLVEEEIVGIEYKFTKPIIYLNKAPEEKKASVQEEEHSYDQYKKEFKDHAMEKNIPQEKISFLWRNHVQEALNRKKEFFVREAKKRNLSNPTELWDSYKSQLLETRP